MPIKSKLLTCGSIAIVLLGSSGPGALAEPQEGTDSRFATAIIANDDPLDRRPSFVPEARTGFETGLIETLRPTALVREDEVIGPAYKNARGVRLKEGEAVLTDIGVWGRKMGISLDGTGQVLIKNFAFAHRRSMDPYGAGIFVGEKTPTTGVTYISNAYIDLAEPGPNPNYKIANNEAIAVERGNAPVKIRKVTLLGAEDAAIDAKSIVDIDASFLASGHRTVRVWDGSVVTIANSTILAFPGYSGIWFGKGETKFRYYNCRFGEVGAAESELSSDPPEWMISRDEGAEPELIALEEDPFEREGETFWVPSSSPTPAGYLKARTAVSSR